MAGRQQKGQSRRRTLTWSRTTARTWGFVLALSVMLVTPGSSDAFLLVKTVLVLVCGFGVAAVQAWHVRRGQASPVAGGAVWVLVAFMVGVLLTSAASPLPITSLVGHYGFHTGALLYLSLATSAVALASAVDVDDLGVPLKGVAIGGVLVAAYCLLQWGGLDPFRWEAEFGGSFATLGNPNYAGAYLGLAMGPLWWWMRNRVPGWTAATVLALVVVAIFTTRSEQGFVAGALSLGVPVVAHLAHGGRLQRRGAVAVGAALLLAVIVAGTALAGVGPAGFVGERIGSQQRVAFWSASWGMTVSEPAVGVGFDLFGEHYREYRSAEAAARVPPQSTTSAAHSVPLQFFATGGFLVGLTYLMVIVVAAVGWLRLRGTQGRRRELAAVWGGVWLSYQAQSFVSVDVAPLAAVHWSSVAALLVLVATLTPSRVLHHTEISGRIRAQSTVLVPVFVLLTLVTVVGGVATLAADSSAGLYEAALREARPDIARDAAARSASTAPWQPRYAVLHASAIAQQGDAQQARDRFAQVWEASAGLSVDAALNAARASLVLDDPEGTSVWYERVVELEPHHPEILLEAGRAFVAINDRDSAREVLERLAGTVVEAEARDLLEGLG